LGSFLLQLALVYLVLLFFPLLYLLLPFFLLLPNLLLLFLPVHLFPAALQLYLTPLSFLVDALIANI